ncbi:MAG: SusC/RagA family TonB-linked outer membrane protein [Ferruginibacter sp.]
MRKVLVMLMMIIVGFIPFVTHAQVKGKITDARDGTSIAAATIKVRGENTSAVSKVDGTFEIAVKAGKTLEISEIGYAPQSFKYSGNGDIIVQLYQDQKSLSEVVVTGIGVATSKKKVAFAVETVSLSNQVKTPSGDVGQQLVGQIAGAQISSTNGSPGAPLNILLRGINTIRGGTFPMILIDGVEVKATDFNSLDVNAYERVEVIQGAAAASLYGAQGANGVIQLFSKKGKLGRINIEVSSSATTNELLNIGDVRKSRYHAFVTNANNEVISSGGTPITFDPENSEFSANVQYSALSTTSFANKSYDKNLQYYDHYKMFFQKGYVFNNSITISGSKEKSDFLISASNNKQNSNFKGNGDYQRSNLTTNFGVELAKNLRLRSSTQLIYTKNTLNDATGRGIVYALNNTRPFANYEFKDNDGNYGHYFGDAAGVNGENPNYINQYSSTLNNKVDVVQNFNLNYKFPKFLELDVKYGLNFQQQNLIYRYENQELNKNAESQQFWTGNYNPDATGNTTGEIDNQNNRTVFQNFLASAIIRTDFEKDFHLKIPIKTSTLLTYDYRRNNYKQFYAYGYDAPIFSPWNASQAGVYKVVSDYTEPLTTYGFLVNQRFEYGDIAGISAGFRSDYSSASYRPGAKGQNFPRGDAYINISNFGFWKNTAINDRVNYFKIRAAYGEAGIQPGAFQRFLSLGSANLGTSNVFTFPVDNNNKDIQIEKSKETELGADFGFKILQGDWLRNGSFSFSVWNKKTNNAIYAVDVAPSQGYGTSAQNAYGLESKGVQASLNLNLVSTKKYNWDLTVNFSNQTSKISSVIGSEVVITSAAGSSNYVLRAGEKIGQLYGFLILKSLDQVDPNTGQPFIAKADQGLYEVASNGYLVNKATKRPVNSPQQYAFGDPNPKFNMSFINNFTYKNFVSFNMQWDWVYGSHLYNQTKSWMYRDGISGDYEKPISITNPVTNQVETQAYTAFYRGIYQAGANNGTKDYFYENASFLRLRNISIAFDFSKLVKTNFLQKAQLVLSGRNLVTKTKYTGYDPEISSGGSNSTFDRGVDHNTIPNTKSYTIGLNFGL